MFARLLGFLRLFSLWRVSHIKQDEAIENNPPDCIVMLAFGQQLERVDHKTGLSTGRIIPGPANEAIAKVFLSVDSTITYPGGKLPPILAQWQFSETQAFKSSLYRGPKIEKVFMQSKARSTRKILEEVKEYMDQLGWSRAVIVAHPWHLVRCIWIAQSIGIEVVHDQLVTNRLNAYANVWNKNVWTPNSQKQTTSLSRWLWHELKARSRFLLKS